MTGMARSKRDFVLSTRAPYAPMVMLIGALAVIAVVIRLLNTSSAPASSAPPLSGAPVGGDAPVVTQPGANTASGSLSLLLPINEAGDTLAVGPAAFPPGASIALSVTLPTDQPTSVDIGLARMGDDGTLEAAQPVAIDVSPDSDGMARVSTTVKALTQELGAGIYRVSLTWQGDRIGGTDVALGQAEPSNVAIFDEPRTVTFEAGNYVGVQVNAKGKVTDRQPHDLGKSSSAPAAAYGMLSGTPHLFITAGLWAGHWIPLTNGVALQ
jgi:hypothetical protein